MAPKTLKSIRTSALGRSLAMLRLTAKSSVQAAGQLLAQLPKSESAKQTAWQNFLKGQAGNLAEELGKLKGGMLKAGQMLSVYGEHFFPDDVNQLLKVMQADTPFVDFAVMRAALVRELGDERLSRLEVDPTPLAAASLGQVHRARIIGTAGDYCLKIQYPGVEQAIDQDLAQLRRVLTLFNILPRGGNYDAVFGEISAMLHREVDYATELTTTEKFRDLVADDPRFIVPCPVAEFSTRRVLMTVFEPGAAVDSSVVKALSQERRSALASAALALFFREFFQWRLVQTDPHFGNYRIRLAASGEVDRWVLYDFGAVRAFPEAFLRTYYGFIHAGLTRDRFTFERCAQQLGIILAADSHDVRTALYELTLLVLEPFESIREHPAAAAFYRPGDAYAFGASDLPQRIAKSGLQLLFAARPRSPAQELVFLDRKLAGVYTVLHALGASLPARQMLRQHLQAQGFKFEAFP